MYRQVIADDYWSQKVVFLLSSIADPYLPISLCALYFPVVDPNSED
jgi:hypothetical protein